MNNIGFFQTRDDIHHNMIYKGETARVITGPLKKIWIKIPATKDNNSLKLKVVEEKKCKCKHCYQHDTWCYILQQNFVAFKCTNVNKWCYTEM